MNDQIRIDSLLEIWLRSLKISGSPRQILRQVGDLDGFDRLTHEPAFFLASFEVI